MTSILRTCTDPSPRFAPFSRSCAVQNKSTKACGAAMSAADECAALKMGRAVAHGSGSIGSDGDMCASAPRSTHSAWYKFCCCSIVLGTQTCCVVCGEVVITDLASHTVRRSAQRGTHQLTSCSFALPDAAATVPQHALMSTRTLIFAILCLACTMTKLNACLLEELALQPHVTSPLSEPRLCKHPVLLLYYLHCLHNACAWTEGTTMVWATPLARGTRCSLTHACIAAPCCWWIPIECSMFLRPDYLDDLALQRPTVFSSGCSFAARTQVSADRLES